MTERDQQRRLDQLAFQYLDALDAEDFDAIGTLWEQAESDAELATLLHELNAELAAEEGAAVDGVVLEQIAKHLPSAVILRPTPGPLTVAEVAEMLRKQPPRGLASDDLKLNDVLLKVGAGLPDDLGISKVIHWGAQFGSAPEEYWQAFRQTALKLRMQRESAVHHQMAARPTKPKPPESKP